MYSSEVISKNIEDIRRQLPVGVELVAVSKFQPPEAVLSAYEAGQRVFGESRVQEFLPKVETLPRDIRWHFIGHLQTNKVKSIIGKTALIESVDSLRLANVINVESEKAGIITNVLLQVHVAAEEAKFGFYPEELRELFKGETLSNLRNLNICGLMGMATNTEDIGRIKEDFAMIATLFREMRELSPNADIFKELSMGMSGDWPLAVEEGANIIRVGSAIFGSRT